MKIKLLRVLLMTAFFSLSSCGGDSDSPAAETPDIPATGSYIRASVDGAAFTTKVSGNENVFVLKSGLGIQITGNNSNTSKVVHMYLDGTPQVGTYTINSSSDSTLDYVENGAYYEAGGCAGASGTITITAINDTRVEGTFQLVGKDTDNCAGPSRTVTNGVFRAVY